MTPTLKRVYAEFLGWARFQLHLRFFQRWHSPQEDWGSPVQTVRSRFAAHWASWADCVRMVKERHPPIADMIHHLQEGLAPSFLSVRACARCLVEAGFDMVSWDELSRAPPTFQEDPEPNQPKVGWQQKATRKLEERFIQDEVWPALDDTQRALLQSQHGPLASSPFTAVPTSRVTRMDAQPFRLLMCRRLHLPLPLSLRTCRCGRRLDSFGHHRAAAQVCREAGARVATNVLCGMWTWQLSTLWTVGGWKWVVDGLTLWHGAQLAIDTTLVSPLRRDGTARRRAANHDGAALEEARQRKERTCPELSGDGGRARLVVLAAEVGGRWSHETAEFLCALAKARAQHCCCRAQAAWLRRWSAMLACSAARSFSLSLLDYRPVPSTGAVVPSVQEVMWDDRFAWPDRGDQLGC